MRANDMPEVKQGLKDRIVEVCSKLLPGGAREGRLWVAHNPRFADDAKHKPALKVAVQGDKGAWKDWRSGDKGDVINLIMHCKGTDTAGAMTWARDFLGIRQMTREERDAMRLAAAKASEREAEASRKAREFKLVKAQELWRKGTALGSGGPLEAHVRAYFRARGCALEDVAHLAPQTFRLVAESEWWKGATWDYHNGQRVKRGEGPAFPAVHSAMRQATGAISCCHVTFLDPVRAAKAPVEPAKLMFGEAAGAVIELASGPGGTSFWQADAMPLPLILCEGIETGLSLAKAVPEARVWAGGSLSGMGGAPIHLSCVADVTVARDNNAGNAQAQAQLTSCLLKLEDAGKPLVVINSHVGDDFNDLTQEHET